MAIYAVATDLLRDSLVHFVRLVGGADAGGDQTPQTSAWAAAIYWMVFLALIGAALYCGMLDLRYIRFQYAVEKRAIFGRTLGDQDFREALIKASKEKE